MCVIQEKWFHFSFISYCALLNHGLRKIFAKIEEFMRIYVPCFQVEKMTVAQLKDFLISEGVKVDSHLRKADLIACLYKHLGIQPIP